MLVLARRAGEKIIIGNGEIKITTLNYNEETKQVKLGFEAAKEIIINREEVYERMKAEKAEKAEKSEAKKSEESAATDDAED